MPEATWKPHEKHGRLTMQSDLPDSVYAFPKQRKEPLTDHNMCVMRSRGSIKSSMFPMPTVPWRSRTSRKLQTTTTVKLAETSWHDLGIHPQKGKREPAAK